MVSTTAGLKRAAEKQSEYFRLEKKWGKKIPDTPSMNRADKPTAEQEGWTEEDLQKANLIATGYPTVLYTETDLTNEGEEEESEEGEEAESEAFEE